MSGDAPEHAWPDEEDTIDRRRLLRAGSASLLAMGLAGCGGDLSERRTYRSPWVSLASDGRPAEITFEDDEEVEIERRFEAEEVGSLDVRIVSHVAGYRRRGAGFVGDAGVAALSTPAVEEADEALNPAARLPLAELLTSDIVGPFLARLGVDPRTWRESPRRVRETPVTLLDTETTVETFTGVTDEDEVVLLNVTRATVNGDVVVVGDVRTRSTDEGGSTVTDTAIEGAIDLFLPIPPLVMLERAGAATTTVTADPEEFPPGRIQMSEVPQAIRRRAARLVEDVRGKPVTWSDGASLGGFAHPVERPDVEDVAYYELAVDPTGFVICATDEHDAPIPHYNTDQATLGERLAERGDGDLERLVWVDRLRYVAENEDGQKMAAYGNQVPKIEGLDALLDADEEGVRSVRYGPPPTVGDVPDGEVDEGYEPVLLESANDRAPPEEASIETWDSYRALLDGYEDTYGPLLDDLADRASDAWETMGETRSIPPGTAHREPILGDQRVEDVDGPTVGDLFVERHAREAAHDALVLTPTTDAVGEEISLTLDGAAGRETLTYHVQVDAGPQSGRLDRVGGSGAGGTAKWTAWAGGFSIQPKYRQFPHDGCFVGCGPVSWAILFGWADRQADSGQFNSTWNPRYGLYQDGGRRYSNDAVAPLELFDSNDNRNGGVFSIIREISQYVDTFCVNNTQAASLPGDMDEARQYFDGRTHASLQVFHSLSGRPRPKCKSRARKSIRGDDPEKGQTPVIVGKGFLSHYPIAYAYRKAGWPGTDEVKVNNAWGTHDDIGADAIEWIWAQSWFSGEIFP